MIVYDEQRKKLLLLIEVQSSSMVYSERKAVIGAANVLRFLRNSDSSFEEFNSFVFPKKGEKQSVMKVTVTWMNFHFQYNLKRDQVESYCTPMIHSFIPEAKKAIRKNIFRLKHLVNFQLTRTLMIVVPDMVDSQTSHRNKSIRLVGDRVESNMTDFSY